MNDAWIYILSHKFECLLGTIVTLGVLGPVARKMGYPKVATAMEGLGTAFATIYGLFRPGVALPSAPSAGTGVDVEAGK